MSRHGVVGWVGVLRLLQGLPAGYIPKTVCLSLIKQSSVRLKKVRIYWLSKLERGFTVVFYVSVIISTFRSMSIIIHYNYQI